MKRRIFSMLLCACMLMGIVSVTTMAASPVSIFNVTVEAPKAGAKPAETASVPETASTYVTDVEWKGTFDNNGNFMKGKTYVVRVTIRIKDGQDKYIKFVSGKAKINDLTANVIDISADKQQAVVTRSFAVGINYDKAAELMAEADVNLMTITVPEPTAGQLPSKTASLQKGAKTTVSNVEWTGRFSHDGTFIAGAEYSVKFKVVIKSEFKEDKYTLTDASKITVNGNQATVKKENNREAYVTYKFTTPIPEGQIDMSYVLTKEQADHYCVDNHNDDLIFNDEFVDYIMDNPYVFGLDMPLDRYLANAHNYKDPEYQLSYIKRILLDFEKNAQYSGGFAEWTHELKELWIAPNINIDIIININAAVGDSYYGSGGANVGTFKLFLSKDVYPDGWYSIMSQSIKEIDTDEIRNYSYSNYQLYLYEGDVYEAFKKGESAAELWCPGHKFINPLITADRVAEYVNCQHPTTYYYSCKFCNICEYDPNHTFKEADEYDVYSIERMEHVYGDRVLADKNYAGLNADGEKVYFKQCVYCGINPKEDFFNYSEEDFKKEFAEFYGKPGYEYVTYEWHMDRLNTQWNDYCSKMVMSATTKKAAPHGFAVYPDRETTAKISDWATDEVRWATQLQLTDKALLGENYTASCTREQFVSVAVKMTERMLGREIEAAPSGSFSDTDSIYVRKAVMAGITNGTGPDTFSPNDTLTRAQMATFLYRALQFVRNNSDIRYTVYDSALGNYSDGNQIPDWANKAMAFMNALGLIKGTTATTIAPNDTCTIEQALVVAYRSLDADDIGWYQSLNEFHNNSRGYLGGTLNKFFSVGIGGTAAFSSYTNADRYWSNKPHTPANLLDGEDTWRESNALPVLEPYTGIQSAVPLEDFMPIKDVD
ncbi:MAG: S-layer homology domain-containing protein [Ruminococcaceae bacterium]|nr:S-layer homology domain-containing protein [Oscillospiraceae bacterium]